MKGIASLVLCLLVGTPCAGTAQVVITGSKSWSSSELGPLPVRIMFYQSSPEAHLDTVAVKAAATYALVAAQLPPDVVISWFQPAPPSVLHLNIEVNAYDAGEVRFDAQVRGASGEIMPGCGAGAQWKSCATLDAALQVSHRLRDVIACAKERYGITW